MLLSSSLAIEELSFDDSNMSAHSIPALFAACKRLKTIEYDPGRENSYFGPYHLIRQLHRFHAQSIERSEKEDKYQRRVKDRDIGDMGRMEYLTTDVGSGGTPSCNGRET